MKNRYVKTRFQRDLERQLNSELRGLVRWIVCGIVGSMTMAMVCSGLITMFPGLRTAGGLSSAEEPDFALEALLEASDLQTELSPSRPALDEALEKLGEKKSDFTLIELNYPIDSPSPNRQRFSDFQLTGDR